MGRAFRPATVRVSDLRQNALCEFWYNGKHRLGRIDRVTSRNITLEMMPEDAPMYTSHVNSGVYKQFTISKIQSEFLYVGNQATRANGTRIGAFEKA